ncbi:hypothetical protein [Serratia rubidaea]|uniref:hypothetical protein n=2 Tax=Serratia rubidaea TaxID=61652 RepID=UPI001E440D9E|nr:hypothetical protein [Serratia rubidaea]
MMAILEAGNIILTFTIILVCYYFANRVIKGSRRREQGIIEQGADVYVTILSLKQSGLFINNNPVIEMDLRLENPESQAVWMLEKHRETVPQIALSAYQLGLVYQAKANGKNDFVFIKDNSGKPVAVSY